MYQVLARKKRPQSFDTLVGQQHIARTLRNAIDAGRLAHAYIFSGLRGTGKTSAARILAKCLNCEKGPVAEPCQQCDPCTEITLGRSIDVLEMDAASRTGVNDIRELQEVVSYAPARDRYKVLIIDEVHMLSKQAFNALLKTLEEPPPRVVFILATTELQKVLPTIRSRCQVFEFRRVPPAELIAHLERICAEEEIKISTASLDRIARAGEGSVRDSLSVLERILAFCGNEISDEDVLQVLGAVRTEILVRMIQSMAARDAAGMLESLDNVLAEGRDLLHFWNELLAVLRDLLVDRVAKGDTGRATRSKEEMNALRKAADRLSPEDLNRIFGVLAALEAGLKSSSQPRFLFEAVLIRIASLGAVVPIERFIEKLSEGGGGISPTRGQKKNLTQEPRHRVEAARATGRDFRRDFESALENQTRPMLTALMKHARKISLGESGVVIRFPPDGSSLKAQAEKKESLSALAACAEQTAGKPVPIRIEIEPDGEKVDPAPGGRPGSGGDASLPGSGTTGSNRPADRRSLDAEAKADPAVRHLLREFGAQILDIRPLESPVPTPAFQEESPTEDTE